MNRDPRVVPAVDEAGSLGGGEEDPPLEVLPVDPRRSLEARAPDHRRALTR
jgi:hypothetical protein